MISDLKDTVSIARPHHWVKNLLVIAPAFFAGIVFSSKENFITTFLAFAAFSLISSVGYIINDFMDSAQDSRHPVKNKRPLASGAVTWKKAFIIALVFFILTLIISVGINLKFVITMLTYLLVTTLYSIYLKKIFLVDALCIASGFLLRIIAGGVALNVEVSSWLYITTLLLSLLLVSGKRRVELLEIKSGENFREVLKYYSEGFLDKAVYVLGISSILTFSLYSAGQGWIIFTTTTPFVIFGTLRYIYLVKHRSKGDPTDALLKDFWMFALVLSWIVLFGIIIYLT